jgi:hypothetical protein
LDQLPVLRHLSPLLLLAALNGAAQAAPFSYDPVSFTGYANQVFKNKGEKILVRNLGTCMREGKDRSGYRCLSGELLQDLPAQKGRNFCKLDALWYVPLSKTVQYRTASCQFKGDQQRMIEGGQQLLRKGLERLENYGR